MWEGRYKHTMTVDKNTKVYYNLFIKSSTGEQRSLRNTQQRAKLQDIPLSWQSYCGVSGVPGCLVLVLLLSRATPCPEWFVQLAQMVVHRETSRAVPPWGPRRQHLWALDPTVWSCVTLSKSFGLPGLQLSFLGKY